MERCAIPAHVYGVGCFSLLALRGCRVEENAAFREPRAHETVAVACPLTGNSMANALEHMPIGRDTILRELLPELLGALRRDRRIICALKDQERRTHVRGHSRFGGGGSMPACNADAARGDGGSSKTVRRRCCQCNRDERAHAVPVCSDPPLVDILLLLQYGQTREPPSNVFRPGAELAEIACHSCPTALPLAASSSATFTRVSVVSGDADESPTDKLPPP